MPTGGFKGGIPDWGKQPWIDEKTGIGWPGEGAFRQFYSDMRLAFRDSVGFIGEGHGRAPVVHTAQGRQSVQCAFGSSPLLTRVEGRSPAPHCPSLQ